MTRAGSSAAASSRSERDSSAGRTAPRPVPKLTDRQLEEAVGAAGRDRPIEAGEVLFRDGDRFQDPMALLKGKVEIVHGPPRRAPRGWRSSSLAT